MGKRKNTQNMQKQKSVEEDDSDTTPMPMSGSDNKKRKKRSQKSTSVTNEVTVPSKVHGSWPPLRKDTIGFFELIIDEYLRPDPAEIKSKKKRIECQNYFNELRERLMGEIREINGPTKKMATYQDIKKETVALEADLKLNTEQIEHIDEEIQKYEKLMEDIEGEIEKLED